ncbi:Protein CBG14491 [Caenorhabditis briggsae]|uniref:Uncharacterized protein n=2 Tax=Caenorhabditis briggsae TaxID=6238 RepID=A0AAE9CUZ4_CAEBR|nr:Protein CBG14491 [Caenorhabditis briggsae]ULT82144.1 hypothetical protein L3Y34_011841 [Caenorhabditis briggsae]CAP32994.1 Protein CBG14491 [Caenorhabditis briggsae]
MCAISKCAFLAVLSCLLAVDCASVGPMPALNHFQDIPQELHHIKTKHRVKRTYIDDMDCAPQEFEMVHTIMDRICHLCHELHSHFAPNTRVECRNNCFRNERFQSCMKIFSAKKPVQSVEPTAPVPLYSEDVQTLDDIKERRRRI